MTGKKLVLIALLAAIALTALYNVARVHGTPPEEARPSCPNCNIILFSMDTLRADHVGALGYARNTTPRMDELARSGLLFRNAFSTSSWTVPSHTSMMTGLYPSEHGYTVSTLKELSLNGKTTLSEELLRNGYATAAITGGYPGPFFGPTRGFSYYYQGSAKEVHLSSYRQRAEEFIASNQDRPFFLFLHAYDAHAPYLPFEEYRGLYASAVNESFDGIYCNSQYGAAMEVYHPSPDYSITQYDAEIRAADEEFGRVVDTVRALGIENRTLYVFVSDHGEEFLEHGMCGHWQLHSETNRVPLVIAGPGIHPAQINGTASHVDLFPTILEYLGLSIPPQSRGQSLLYPPNESRRVYTERIIRFTDGDWAQLSGVVTPQSRSIIEYNSTSQTYSLTGYYEDGPLERDNLAPTLSEARREQLLAEALDWQAGLPPASLPGALADEFDDNQQQLRELGYLNG